MLACTDAALGQAVVTDERIPSRVRQGLNVESGLNDGLCVPIFFIAIAVAEADAGTSSGHAATNLVLEQIGYGLLGGIPAGILGALALRFSARRGLIEPHWMQILTAASALLAAGIASALGGSIFIAAFTGGFVFGALRQDAGGHVSKLVDEGGEFFDAVTFIVFGAVILGPVLDEVTWQVVLYAVLSLTVVRMLPVALALIGTGARRPTVAFLGWFGPRGLASIVFAVILIDDADLPHLRTLVLAIAATIALSVYVPRPDGQSAHRALRPLVDLTPARRAADDGERPRRRAPPARPLARRSTRRRYRRGYAETNEPLITSLRAQAAALGPDASVSTAERDTPGADDTRRRATSPDSWHPMHRHDVAARELSIRRARYRIEAKGAARRSIGLIRAHRSVAWHSMRRWRCCLIANAGEHDLVMSERDDFLTWVNTSLYGAELALHNGDAGPRRARWSRREPVSVLGAWRSAYGREEFDELFSYGTREELLRLHVLFARAAGVRCRGRHGVYRWPGAHLGLRRRSAAQLHPAGHPGVPARGRRVEGRSPPRRHRR